MGPSHSNKSAHGSHLDVHIYYPEGKSGLHPISAMRQLIEEMQLPPFEAPCKIFILHDAERMLPSASNALLKTFEEPTLDSYIILLSSECEAMLPTIVSRCRKISFFSVAEDEIAKYIEQKYSKSPDEARRIAFLSHGSIGKAHALIEQEETSHKSELIMELLSNSKNIPALLSSLAKLEECLPQDEDSDGIKQIDAVFEELLYWYRDLYLVSNNCDRKYLFYREHLSTLETAQREVIPLEKAFMLIAEARLAVQRNIKPRIALEHFFLQLSQFSGPA